MREIFFFRGQKNNPPAHSESEVYWHFYVPGREIERERETERERDRKSESEREKDNEKGKERERGRKSESDYISKPPRPK